MGLRHKPRFKDVIDVDGPCRLFFHGKRVVEIEAPGSTTIKIRSKDFYRRQKPNRLTKRRENR